LGVLRTLVKSSGRCRGKGIEIDRAGNGNFGDTKSVGEGVSEMRVDVERDGEEAIHEYLSQIFADGDSDEIIRALGYVAKVRGMTQLARDSGLGRENLYYALKPGAKPRFDTVLRLCRALGLNLEPRRV
jgi:probable addiction module antidote protein